MRWHVAMGLALLLMAAPLSVHGDAGRAAPECLSQSAASLPPSLTIDPDVCVIVDLGVLTPGDVYDLSIIVVDDAIVVVEAVTVKMDEGMSPKDATIAAMKEVSGPIVATSLALIAVFVPVAFMGGITGRLYQQFAITIAISVALSSVNALTLSPAQSFAAQPRCSKIGTCGSTRLTRAKPLLLRLKKPSARSLG